jgi:hypothetical protein
MCMTVTWCVNISSAAYECIIDELFTFRLAILTHSELIPSLGNLQFTEFWCRSQQVKGCYHYIRKCDTLLRYYSNSEMLVKL